LSAKNNRSKNSSRLYYFLSFTLTLFICLFAFAGFTAIFLLFNQRDTDFFNSTSSIAKPVATVSDSTVLICYDIGEKPKSVIANLLFSQNAVTVAAVADRSVDVHNRTDILSGHYLYGGISVLKSAVQLASNSKIDKYLVMSEDALAHIIDSFGGISLNIKENIVDKNSKMLLEKGCFRITGAQAVIVIKYTDDSETLTSTVIDTFLSSSESSKSTIFKYILSACDTDVSYADYYDTSQFLNLLKEDCS